MMTMETTKPLNPQLYKLLLQRFGEVEIANRGVGLRGNVLRAFNGKEIKSKFVPTVAGEYYRVNCPYCRDTRKRLWINHSYGAPDPADKRRTLRWMAVCYNSGCLENYNKAADLEATVFSHMNRNQRGKMRIAKGVEETAELREVIMPGSVLPIAQLDGKNPVVRYLTARGFDVPQISRVYGVTYCVESEVHPICVGRIIVPIVMHGELVGWQGRWPEDLDWKASRIPKYYGLPGMPKRLMLYNYDRARHYKTVIVTEGVTDVWKVGGPAVALLGKKLHPMQRKLLAEFDAAIIAIDPDASDEATELVHDLRRMFDGRVARVDYPDGEDAGSTSTQDNWRLIYAAADAAGIPESVLIGKK